MDNNDSMKPQQTGGLKLMTVFIAVLALHVLVIGGFTVYHLMGSGGSDADLTLDKTHKLKADGTVVADTPAPDAATPDKTADATSATDTATAPATTGTATAPASPAPSTTDTATPAAPPAQVAATTPATPAASSAAPSPIVLSSDDMAQTSTIPEGLAPPPEPTLAPSAPVATPAPAPTPAVVASQPATLAPPAPAPSAPITPAPSMLSSSAPSGPVMPEGQVATGPVHMPLNPPASDALAPGEDNASAPGHDEHTSTLAHEAKKEFYTVKITDSYQKIAHAHHVTVAQLKAVNHIKGNTLHAGERLIIPLSNTSIAKSEKLHESTGSETASLSASPASSAKTHRHYYTVAKGDTLKKIAKKFNVSALAIEDANDLSGPKVAVGEKLRIPSHEARSTASANLPSASLTDRVATPVAAPAPIPPSQVDTQPAPVMQPTPVAPPAPAPAPAPQPTPASSPELTSLNF